jgi:hypothetical protein
MKVLFDFDTVNRKPKIVSDCLQQIREHFSVEDKALLFLRRRTGRNMPVRKYAIGQKGHFEYPFFETLQEEIKITFPSLTLETSESFNKYKKDESLSNNVVELNLTPRDYQLESAKIGLEKGNGIIVLPTSAGKTFAIELTPEVNLVGVKL